MKDKHLYVCMYGDSDPINDLLLLHLLHLQMDERGFIHCLQLKSFEINWIIIIIIIIIIQEVKHIKWRDFICISNWISYTTNLMLFHYNNIELNFFISEFLYVWLTIQYWITRWWRRWWWWWWWRWSIEFPRNYLRNSNAMHLQKSDTNK